MLFRRQNPSRNGVTSGRAEFVCSVLRQRVKSGGGFFLCNCVRFHTSISSDEGPVVGAETYTVPAERCGYDE